ncbi:carbohydrate porin [Halomonas sp. Y3]|nr:carbohydrate porin [Halomonas sp. Y3]
MTTLEEQRDEYRERLAAMEKQLQDAQQRAQEAEKGRTKAEL